MRSILSLFDGMSCGRLALDGAGISYERYYSAEIDKHAIKASESIYSDNLRLGDVQKWRDWELDWSKVDLVLAGFPCQAWSVAGSQNGVNDERGRLFYDMLAIMTHAKKHNPSLNFLIENVKMKSDFEKFITNQIERNLGEVHKHLINSALVSAQNRRRYYWCNWHVDQPKDRGVTWGHVRESGVKEQCFYYSDKALKWIRKHSDRTGKELKIHADGEKMQMIEASHYKKYSSQRFFGILDSIDRGSYITHGLRYITPRECLRLQTVPESAIDAMMSSGVSNTQLYKIAGNGWTVAVIEHILKSMKHRR